MTTRPSLAPRDLHPSVRATRQYLIGPPAHPPPSAVALADAFVDAVAARGEDPTFLYAAAFLATDFRRVLPVPWRRFHVAAFVTAHLAMWCREDDRARREILAALDRLFEWLAECGELDDGALARLSAQLDGARGALARAA